MFRGEDYVPDYADLYDQYEAAQQSEVDKLPKCDYCGEPIGDDYLYDINGDIICEECLKENFRKPVEDYID